MSDVGPMDGTIDLNFGGVEGIAGGQSIPIPAGVYTYRIDDPHLATASGSSARGIQFVPTVMDEGEFSGRSGRQEWWNIPNRDGTDPKKYETSMGFLRGKLEAVYGVIPDDFKLSVKDLAGRTFIGVTIITVDPKFGEQNKIITYLHPGTDTSGIIVPKNPIPENRGTGGGTAPTNGSTPATSGAPARGQFRL